MPEDTRAYFTVQVEKEKADEVWLAIRKLAGVVDVGEYDGGDK